jgi:DMSO reductase anchor subunit
MHPAKSVIFFTTATGAGYGLFIWLAVLALMGILPTDQMFGFVALFVGFGLVLGGLLSSTLHLGRPERAWRALSQWRSSWLSREGIMAILTFIPLGLFGLSWLFLKQTTGSSAILAMIGAVMSLITVFTTSMIYASLKAIPAWHNIWTKMAYLVLCLMSGAVLAIALFTVFG